MRGVNMTHDPSPPGHRGLLCFGSFGVGRLE